MPKFTPGNERKQAKWDDTTDISKVAEDDGLSTSERIRSRLEGWDSVNLVWRRIKVDSSGKLDITGTVSGGGGTSSVSIGDGNDTALGNTADGAVFTDTTGTVSGKLRGLVKILASVWDSGNNRLVVDGSEVTQPVSGTVAVSNASIPITDNGGSLTVDGTVTVANPTTNPETGLAKDGTLTGGTVKAINRGGAKGSTTAADVTTTAEGTDHQALDVQIFHGGSAINPTTIRALTSSDTVTVVDGGGSLTVDGTVAVSGTIPVTDNSGSLTVDAPVGTPAFVRLSDGAAAITALPVTDNGGNISIDDGGNSITVDGTFWQLTQPVSGTVGISNATFPVTDNSGTLTVDAPVGTPVFTRLSDGTAALTTTSGRLSVDASGVAVPITDNNGSLTVDGSVSVSNLLATQPVSGTVTSNIQASDGISTAAIAGMDVNGLRTLVVHNPTLCRLLEGILDAQVVTNYLLTLIASDTSSGRGISITTAQVAEPGRR
jgi:hypothetical protein